MKKKWAILEFENSHFECIHTTVNHLKNDRCELHFLVTKNTAKRMQKLKMYQGHKVHVLTENKQWLEAAKYCNTHQIKNIFLNSASGKKVLKFLYFSGLRKSKCCGYIHNPIKSNKSMSQWLIEKKLHKKILLSPQILTKQRKDKFEVFQPVYFPEEFKQNHIENEYSEFIIPGQVEFKRRDYQFLMEQISKHHKVFRKEKIVFRCLGSSLHKYGDGKKLKKWITDNQYSDILILADKTGDFDDLEFHALISSADIILPLIHPYKKEYQDYLQDKFSGAFALSIGHQIPMLMSESFQKFDHFNPYHFFYGDFLSACLSAKNRSKIEFKNKLENYYNQCLKNNIPL